MNSNGATLVRTVAPQLLSVNCGILIVAGSIMAARSTGRMHGVLGNVLIRRQVVNIRANTYPRATIQRSPSVGVTTIRRVRTQFPSNSIILVRSNNSGLALAFDPTLISFFVCIVSITTNSGVPHGSKPKVSRSSVLIVGGASLTPCIHTSLRIVQHSSRLVHPNGPFMFAGYVANRKVSRLITLVHQVTLFSLNGGGRGISRSLANTMQ